MSIVMSTVDHLDKSLALLVAATRALAATGDADPFVIARLQDAMAALEDAGADPDADATLDAGRMQSAGGWGAIEDAASELDAIAEGDRTSRMLTARIEVGAVLLMRHL